MSRKKKCLILCPIIALIGLLIFTIVSGRCKNSEGIQWDDPSDIIPEQNNRMI